MEMESPVSKRRKIDCYTSEDSSKDDIHQSAREVNYLEDSFLDQTDRLPEEILIKIIADLPLGDRKNTRMVCRRWYKLNNITPISNKEKFIFYGEYGIEPVLKTLQKTKKEVLHLEFVHFDFSINRNRLLQFWMVSSARIKSLVCTHCKFSEETVQDIIINCDEMQQFAIENPLQKFPPCERDQELMSGPALQKLINIRRGNLESFKLEAYNERWISNILLRVMFDIFPNINDFSFICYIPSRKRSTFARKLRNLVDSKKMMRSIKLDAANDEVHSNLLRDDFPKLTSIYLVDLEFEPEHPIFGFLSRHNYLQFIEFSLEIIDGSSEDRLFLEGLMNSLLDSCTQLRSLRVEASEDVFVTDDSIFPKITNSKLKSLYLNFLLNVADCDKNANTTINKTLKCLHLYSPEYASRVNHEMIPPFVRTFRGLNELMIDRMGVNDALLQDVFLYQRQLTSLSLNCLNYFTENNVKSISDYAMSGKEPNGQRTGYSIMDLNMLRSMELSWPILATRGFLEVLRFPTYLTSLYLEVRLPQELVGSDELVTVFSNLPNLERLVFRGDMHYPSWLKICQQLKKLRLLYLESYFPISHQRKFCDEYYIRFFENCPTLRVLHRSKILMFLSHLYRRMYSYRLDTVTNKVRVVKKPEELLFPPNYPRWVRKIQ